ncbi:hypothetical protein [Streptomyces sp. NTK 937]|uniref:hypothetical protein n=1 Tax=Streptomyces sp. NTK 937 TaxID=1487711 RepID=UPI001F526D46|nr:hypothetical protein [Streptomyces sp. NTK 937]
MNTVHKSDKIPRRKELYAHRTHRGYEIKLVVDIPAWRLAELTPLPVPARLTKPHPSLAALQQRPQPMGLTKSIQGRALRIIQALIIATESQGHKAALGTTQGAPPPQRRRSAPPHFTITTQGESVGFLVLQEQDRSEHIPTDKELADAKKHSRMRIAHFDYRSNRLRFILRGGSPHRASEWADIPDRPMEDQLADIAQEVDLRGKAAEHKRLADQQARKAQQRRWETATEEARTTYAYRLSRQAPRRASNAWHQTKRLTEYVTAVRDHTTSLPPGQERTEIEAWLAFADARLQHLTESAAAPKLPSPLKPSGDDLKPFLGHWSPYGPRSY